MILPPFSRSAPTPEKHSITISPRFFGRGCGTVPMEVIPPPPPGAMRNEWYEK